MLQLAKNHRTFPNAFINDFFNDDLFNFAPAKELHCASSEKPAVNVEETEGEYIIDVSYPGIDKKDFNISVDDNILTISSENKSSNEEKSDGFIRKEFSIKSFSRTFKLPENADANGIKASYTNGILKVEIPKAEEKTKKALEIKID